MHYLPLPLPFFSLLVGALLVVIVLAEIGVLSYAYSRVGLRARTLFLVLAISLSGSYFNIPIARLAERHVVSGKYVDFFGMRYVVPVVVNWPGTVIAVNVGGAVIPVLVSAYLMIEHSLWAQSLVAIGCVTAVSHALAHPVHGIGIAVPIFVPALATAVTALLLSRRHAAALAYVAGSIGTLIGADVLNFDKIRGLGAPVASIGGAGTFDGIFLTGILAVLIASVASGPDVPRRRQLAR